MAVEGKIKGVIEIGLKIIEEKNEKCLTITLL
jgi:hypothetical protein